ncbi:protein SPT2 homolog [Palaemon carinicauda]|uniref:protein SPT2 homolog n=1 Tax=Palaemon carinicauda TaxID=392227 RepID=UPI0035B68A16
MDFSYLLELAKENDKNNKHEAKVPKFSTKISGAKKVQKAAPNVNAIKALLEKKDENKAKADEEFKKKRANLLALRAQDRKANQRVSAMINRTKGASKAVLEDAKDLTTARGEEQCDEDDYGYESAMSQQIFSKLADQYARMPDDDKMKFVKTGKKTSIDDIKNRVINSLKKEEEEEMEPRKRKRKSKFADDDFINDGDAFDDFDEPPADSAKKSSISSSQKTVNINLTNYKSDKYNNFKYEPEKEVVKKKEKKKPKPSAPPPPSFEQLMKIAQQKQTAPVEKVSVDKIIKEKEKEKKKDIDRPLTAKEKEELEEERRRRMRRLNKLTPEGKKEDDKNRKNGADKGKKIEEKVKGKSENTSKLQQALEKPKPEPKPEPKVIDRAKFFAVPGAPRPQPPKKVVDKPMVSAPKNPPAPVKNKPPPPSERVPDKKFQKSRDFPPKDLKPVKSRDFQPKQKSRDFPPLDRRRPQYAPPPPKRGRIESDSEDEYDSDLEGFIDDGEDELDYSSEIKKMFGYDKSRYVDEDDDCDDMEASYSQLQKEERISAKIGLQEDLEDMRREEEEKKLKRLKLKGKGRR